MQYANQKWNERLQKSKTSLEKSAKVTCNLGEVRNDKLVAAKCGAKFSHQHNQPAEKEVVKKKDTSDPV